MEKKKTSIQINFIKSEINHKLELIKLTAYAGLNVILKLFVYQTYVHLLQIVIAIK